jgi:excisionase family DNA binding protein
MRALDRICAYLYALYVSTRKPRKGARSAPVLGEALPTVQSQPSPRPTTPPRVLTPRELADFLKVSPATVRRLLARGQLPHMNVGNRVRFLASEVVDKLRKG